MPLPLEAYQHPVLYFISRHPEKSFKASSISRQVDDEIDPRMVASILSKYAREGYVRIIPGQSKHEKNRYRWVKE